MHHVVFASVLCACGSVYCFDSHTHKLSQAFCAVNFYHSEVCTLLILRHDACCVMYRRVEGCLVSGIAVLHSSVVVSELRDESCVCVLCERRLLCRVEG